MATWSPISNSVPQFSKNAGGAAAADYYLKFYLSGTTTPTSMATDSTGGTLLDKCKINSLGYPVNGSDEVFIPHIDRAYKLALYTNATDADNNATGSAAWVVDGLTFVSSPITSVATLIEEQTAASDVQALFTLTSITYTPCAKNLGVYRNGVRLPQSSYTETSSTSITLNASGATSIVTGDEFEFIVNERDVSTVTTPAANVTYTPAGTGAVATDVQTKLREQEASVLVALAHLPSDGSSHTFINQDVTTTGTPTFGSLTANGGISFDGGTNHLDDYEEGTWTPTAAAYSGVMTVPAARYTKIGRLAYASASVTFDGTTDVSKVNLQSVPFTPSSTIIEGGFITRNTTGVDFHLDFGGTNSIRFRDPATNADRTYTEMGTGTVNFTLIYTVA